MKIITIIGGGAAGLSTLIQLTNKLIELEIKDVSIRLIEKNDHVGPGEVYGTNDDVYLINLPAKGMSPTPEYPQNFIDWLNTNPTKWKTSFPNIDIEKTEFPPRRLFGIYLTDLGLNTKEKAQNHGIPVDFIKDEVIDISLENSDGFIQYQISLSSGSSFLTDQVILCTGHSPSVKYREFLSNPNYLENPWNIKQRYISENAPVCILGSRLTAIDATLALVSNGHTGKIFMVSRGGWLPNVIGQSEPYDRQYVTLDKIPHGIKLDELMGLFWLEIEHAEGRKIDRNKILHPQNSAINFLSQEIVYAKSYKRPWQSVLASIYPIVPEAWNRLDEEGKREFLEKYYSIWLTYLAAFPLENAEKILALLQSGQLEIFGGLSDVAFNETRMCFEISINSDSSNPKIIESESVINCTGAGHDITQVGSPLLKSLLNKELITSHPLGGIQIDFETLRAMDGQNKVNNNIFVVGDLAFGARLATSDMSQVNHQAITVTNFIVNNWVFKKKIEPISFYPFPLCTTKPLLNMQLKNLPLPEKQKKNQRKIPSMLHPQTV